MPITDRVFDDCWTRAPNGMIQVLDLGSFVERLLLFDTVILESPRLHEVGPLVRILGAQHFEGLIESGALEFVCDPLSMAQVNWSEGFLMGRPLPSHHYRLEVIRNFDPKDRPTHVSQMLQGLIGTEGASHKELRALKSQLGTRIRRFSKSSGTKALEATCRDATTHVGLVRAALALELANRKLLEPRLEELDVGFEQVSDGVLRGWSNLATKHGLDPRTEHVVLERVLLAVAALNHRIETMDEFSAIRGVREQDLPIFDEKFRFLERLLDPEVNTVALRRVVRTIGLPDMTQAAESGAIDWAELIKMRESTEIREFRRWLADSSSLSDDDLRDLGASFKTRVGRFAKSAAGRSFRLVVTTLLGIVPAVGPALGTAASAIDSFLIERMLATPAAVSFLSAHLPSIFTADAGPKPALPASVSPPQQRIP